MAEPAPGPLLPPLTEPDVASRLDRLERLLGVLTHTMTVMQQQQQQQPQMTTLHALHQVRYTATSRLLMAHVMSITFTMGLMMKLSILSHRPRWPLCQGLLLHHTRKTSTGTEFYNAHKITEEA